MQSLEFLESHSVLEDCGPVPESVLKFETFLKEEFKKFLQEEGVYEKCEIPQKKERIGRNIRMVSALMMTFASQLPSVLDVLDGLEIDSPSLQKNKESEMESFVQCLKLANVLVESHNSLIDKAVDLFHKSLKPNEISTSQKEKPRKDSSIYRLLLGKFILNN
jgi:hypothetical protein